MKTSEFVLKRRLGSIARSGQKQAGLTLLETIISLVIIASAMVGINAVAERFSGDTKNTVTASQVRTFGEAAKAYIKNNYSAVLAVATSTAPVQIDVATLIAAGNLTTGFSTTNAFGQSMCALVIEPSANNLQAIVVSEGGTTIDDLSLGSIASVIGGSGGAIYASAATTVRGAIGGWSINTSTFDNLVNNVSKKCDGTAGNVRLTSGHPTMALWFENGDTSSAFLSRDAVSGRPELNAMNTPIVMNSVQTIGGTCSAGAFARDTFGLLISCQSGVWKATGDSKCVLTTADLNTLEDDGRCYNGVNLANAPTTDWLFIEVFRHVYTSVYYTEQRATSMNGTVGKVWLRIQQGGTANVNWGSWNQIVDPQISLASGTVTAAADVNAGGNLTAGTNITAGGNVTATGAVTANRGNFSRDGTAQCCGDAGSISLAENTSVTGKAAGISLHNSGVHEGNIALATSGTRRIRFYDNQGVGMGLELSGELQLNRVQTSGAACSPNGLLGRDSVGASLSCVSGFWTKAAASFGGIYNVVSGTCYVANPYTGGCGCPSGYSVTAIINTNGEGGRDLYYCWK